MRRHAAEEVFTPEEVERARRYHRPLYAALALDVVLDVGMLGFLAFSAAGDRMFAAIAQAPVWVSVPSFTAFVLVAAFMVRLPLSFWRGYLHEKTWGFSTQTIAGWLLDRLKGLAVSVALMSGMLLGFFAAVRTAPRSWPIIVAPAAAAVVLLLSFVAPVVLEPVFNRFRPLDDEQLADGLRALADDAGVPVRDVLVADASRRTRKENAYVSGLGRTRRVVLFDTLLRRADPQQVRLVAAHELGHRRLRHVAQATAIGMAGMVVGVLVLWPLLRAPGVLRATGAAGPGDPRLVPFVLFVAALLQLVSLPLETAISRRWETEADRFSLELTRDLSVFMRSHRELAVANLADLDPPATVEALLFTHPSPPRRIANGRRWADELRILR